MLHHQAGERGERARFGAWKMISMLVSILSLGVIPDLRLTNRGLVAGRTFELVPVVVS